MLVAFFGVYLPILIIAEILVGCLRVIFDWLGK